MSLIGKIQTLFSDKDKTKPVFPRTKVKAISDENGVGLDVILSEMDADIAEAANAVNNIDLSDYAKNSDLSDYAKTSDLSNYAKTSALGTQATYTLSGTTLTITTK